MKSIILLLIFASSSLANDFAEAPNGSVYNTRTYYYDENKQEVLVRPEFANLTDSERQDRVGMTNARNNPKWIAATREWEKELAKRRATRTANAQEKARQPTIVNRYYRVYYPYPVYRSYHPHNHYNNSSSWRWRR